MDASEALVASSLRPPSTGTFFHHSGGPTTGANTVPIGQSHATPEAHPHGTNTSPLMPLSSALSTHSVPGIPSTASAYPGMASTSFNNPPPLAPIATNLAGLRDAVFAPEQQDTHEPVRNPPRVLEPQRPFVPSHFQGHEGPPPMPFHHPQ